ncbi:hypothetical protein EZS27_021237 [termite gut metagenome]|uniref:DUF2179 domain-containing protein n=3 Tax=termite gut metagenome TaxID=433724 RepID=A0A5J4RAL7_9ZZZZ
MKLSVSGAFREFKDYLFIVFGLVCYAMGWAAFLLPYQITTGGVAGISAVIFYTTGFPLQYTYFIVNVFLMAFSFKILGFKFTVKTAFSVLVLTFLWELFQKIVGDTRIIGDDQEFMACVLGASLCGIGSAIVFLNNGSTGGTDIIAVVVNKYRDITFGRMILYCDIIIILSCYFIFHDWKRVVFGFVTMGISSYVLDWVVNSTRQSVQFLIFSKEYAKIADHIISDTHRGVTVLDGTGWYSKQGMKVLVVLARKSQSISIFRLVKDIDPNAFISQSSVIGVYGQGFDRLKVK